MTPDANTDRMADQRTGPPVRQAMRRNDSTVTQTQTATTSGGGFR